MGQSIVTPVGRCSFPSLGKLNAFGNYSLTILFPKTDPKVKKFVNWLGNAVKLEAKTHGDANYASAMKEFVSFKNGDDAKAFKTYRNEYAGHWFLSMHRKAAFGAPCVVGRNRAPIDPSEVYAGCDVLAYIDVYAYKFGQKKSVAVGFQHVLKAGENTRFASSGVAVDSAFENLDLPEENADPLSESPFGGVTPQAGNVKVVADVKQKMAAVTQQHDPFAGI